MPVEEKEAFLPLRPGDPGPIVRWHEPERQPIPAALIFCGILLVFVLGAWAGFAGHPDPRPAPIVKAPTDQCALAMQISADVFRASSAGISAAVDVSTAYQQGDLSAVGHGIKRAKALVNKIDGESTAFTSARTACLLDTAVPST
jgi:hypothetical protein